MIISGLIQRLLVSYLLIAFSQTLGAATLHEIRQKGFIDCGVHSSLPGFSIQSDQGWQGMEVDLCRAVAAAVLDNEQKVRFTPFANEQGYNALQSGDIDLLIRHNDWTMLPDTAVGLSFVAPWFYEEQGFLIREKAGVNQLSELGEKKICLFPGVEKPIANLADGIGRVNLPSFGIAAKAFEKNQCQALPGALARLSMARQNFPSSLLTEIIAIDTAPTVIAPLIRQGDHEWFKIVRWVIFWLLNAEQSGFDQASMAQIGSDKLASRIIKSAGISGSAMGLDPNWPIQVIQQTGHYGEIFNRHFGDMQLPRGANNLYHKGGLHFAPPIE